MSVAFLILLAAFAFLGYVVESQRGSPRAWVLVLVSLALCMAASFVLAWRLQL